MNTNKENAEVVTAEVDKKEVVAIIPFGDASSVGESDAEPYTDEVAEEKDDDADGNGCERPDIEAENETEEADEENETEEAELKKSDLKPTELKEKSSSKKVKGETMEETMLRLLLTEQNPELLESALAKGKTIRGAWNYVVSVMKNAYIAQNGRTSGGMCGSPAVVLGIAEKYLREYDEGTLEPETNHVPKKRVTKPESATKTVEKVAKKAAKDAKKDSVLKKNAKISSQEDFFSALGL